MTISDATSGATIYYTTNGITPTTSSSVYYQRHHRLVNETLKAIATASGYSQSAVGSAVYAIDGSYTHLQPGGRYIFLGADSDHQRRNLRRNHLLHHQWKHADDQLVCL